MIVKKCYDTFLCFSIKISKNRAIEECYRDSPNGKMCESVTDAQTHNHETPRAKQKCRHKISHFVP